MFVVVLAIGCVFAVSAFAKEQVEMPAPENDSQNALSWCYLGLCGCDDTIYAICRDEYGNSYWITDRDEERQYLGTYCEGGDNINVSRTFYYELSISVGIEGGTEYAKTSLEVTGTAGEQECLEHQVYNRTDHRQYLYGTAEYVERTSIGIIQLNRWRPCAWADRNKKCRYSTEGIDYPSTRLLNGFGYMLLNSSAASNTVNLSVY